VKILGAVGLIDQGELDWKVFVVREDAEIADKVSFLLKKN
jgi:inorganic pyrophosphatase